MIWLADGASSYRCGDYRVIFAIKFWTSWCYGPHPRKLGDSESAKTEMTRCEAHKNNA